jgi:flagellar biosynthesis/type III secretory pathway chaperone
MKQESLAELKQILEQEEDVLSRLLSLEKDKNRILVSGDYNDLSGITDKEDRLTDTLTDLEEKRQNLLPSPQKEQSLTEVLGSGTDWKVRKSHLTGLLKDLRLYNDMNRRILEESIAFFRYSLSLFTGEETNAPVYAPDGERRDARGNAALVLDRSI